jgi:hypothetical protein
MPEITAKSSVTAIISISVKPVRCRCRAKSDPPEVALHDMAVLDPVG